MIRVLFALLLALPTLGFAQSLPTNRNQVALVQLINFGCSMSRQVEAESDRIAQVAKDRGVAYVIAPVAWETQTLWPDRMYYALRALHPEWAGAARLALFNGMQRSGMKFEDLAQVTTYLEQDPVLHEAITQKGINWAGAVVLANQDDPLISEAKALRLLDKSGAEDLPAFLWVLNGEIIHREFLRDDSVPQLVRRVINVMDPRQPLDADH